MLIAIFGPTGSGKTDIAVEVAAQLGTDVINADPAQCYEGLPILTNKPGAAHDAVALHRLVGGWPLTHEASVAEFAERAHTEIDELLAGHGGAVVCGGSGLYQRAALTRMQFGPSERPDEPGLREVLIQEASAPGGEERLHAELAARDPVVAARVHPNDTKRVVRALEVARTAGSVSPDGRSIWDAPYRVAGTVAVWLVTDRELIRQGINARTHRMFKAGVLAEVEELLGPEAAGFDELSTTAQRLHGLEDCVRCLRGELELSEAERLMATRTRQYAKRQDTWARRWPGILPVPVDLHAFDAGALATLVLARAREERARVDRTDLGD